MRSQLRWVNRFIGNSTDHRRDELFSATQYGLTLAAQRYDWRVGFPFGAYARHVATGEYKRALRDFSRTVRQPRQISETTAKISKAVEVLHQKRPGTQPTIAEIAAEASLSVDDIQAAMHPQAQRVESLDRPRNRPGQDSSQVVGDTIADSGDLAEEVVTKLDFENVVAGLSERKQRIIAMRNLGMTQGEAADVVGVSQMHVSRELRQARDALQAAITRTTSISPLSALDQTDLTRIYDNYPSVSDRDRIVVELRRTGRSLEAIGEHVGLSPKAVQRIEGFVFGLHKELSRQKGKEGKTK